MCSPASSGAPERLVVVDCVNGHGSGAGENNQRVPNPDERVNLDARNRLGPRDRSTYLVAETNKMGNRFIHYRQEDALAMMDNRVDLVRATVEFYAVNTLGVCRQSNLVHKEVYKKIMKEMDKINGSNDNIMKKMDKIDGSNDDIMAQVQLLREDGEQQRNEHQRELDIAQQRVNMAEQRANDLVLILKTINFSLVASVVEASGNIDACRSVSMEEDNWSRFVDRGGLFSDFDELTCLQILNFERRLTMAFVHGLAAEEILHVTRELAKHRGRLALPMLLPTILVETRVQVAIFGVRDCHREIVLVAEKTGLLTKWDSSEALSDMRKNHSIQNPAETVDFNAVTADITSVKSKLAYVEYLCEIWSPKLVAFDCINSHTVQSVPAESARERLVNINRGLQDEINFHLTSLEGMQVRAKHLSKRAEAQVQIVSTSSVNSRHIAKPAKILSLIAQRDNALALRDNANLKTITEDQRRIALAATRLTSIRDGS
ncbi:hypothetical protein DL768_002875 [Monosporascus sp. mg162]|nr:hypothetical protein DL768_002875 [Monosporascus sp. mg162]